MKTNIGKLFIKLVRKHFPENNKYHKIFNLKNLKLSYCCPTNFGNIIKLHNSKVVSKANDNNIRKGTCRSKPNSPLNGVCLVQCLVYKGTSKHPITALFTMELLNGSSKHGITTMQNLLDIVNA